MEHGSFWGRDVLDLEELGQEKDEKSEFSVRFLKRRNMSDGDRGTLNAGAWMRLDGEGDWERLGKWRDLG